jgi:2'-5' RNA ligase
MPDSGDVVVAVELFFDAQAEAAVRRLWDALDDGGCPSIASQRSRHYRAHLSLAVFDTDEDLRLPLTEALRDVELPPLVLGHLGVFPGRRSVVFVGVSPSAALVDLHDTIERAVPDRPDATSHTAAAWTPHCTLATRVRDPARAIDIVARRFRPIEAHGESVHLLDTSRGELVEVTTRSRPD